MIFEEKYEMKQYKKNKQHSFNSRYDNSTKSYFKYYKFANLCKINYLPDNQINLIILADQSSKASQHKDCFFLPHFTHS